METRGDFSRTSVDLTRRADVAAPPVLDQDVVRGLLTPAAGGARRDRCERPKRAETVMTDTSNPPELWALVLAGGDGRRLQELTRRLAGRPIPKQYCRIAGDRSMLEATLDRIAPLVPRERTLVIVNRDHLDLARSQLAGLPPENMLVQPSNRDTGPGLLWSLLALERRAPGALLATLPSDHYIADDSA